MNKGVESLLQIEDCTIELVGVLLLRRIIEEANAHGPFDFADFLDDLVMTIILEGRHKAHRVKG